MTLTEALKALRGHGATRVFFKELAPNDNSKNQIYLGRDPATLSILKGTEITPETKSKKHQFKIRLSFAWLLEDGRIVPAPETKLIYYPQYPEARLSGMLVGTGGRLASLVASRATGRTLLLGTAPDGRIVGFVSASPELLAELNRKNPVREIGALRELAIEPEGPDSRTVLLERLGEIHKKGWIPSWRLNAKGNRLPCRSRNCGGFTLEAELGVRPSGRAEPDFLGWELKQHAVPSFEKFDTGVVTLMTPEPSEGEYKKNGAEAFVRKYGYPDKLGRTDRLNFGGIYRRGRRVESTGLTLGVEGYDPHSGAILYPKGGIVLLDQADDVAARWPFESLLQHWTHKHANAAYVSSLLRQPPDQAYWFGPTVQLGTLPSVDLFLRAVHSGIIYYDPGMKVEQASSSSPRLKRRSQFRIRVRDLPKLYREFESVSVA